MYDAIIVGARVAGAPTAMLLARAGQRVLLVDRDRFPSDTMSTHYIHQPGMASLKRWGLLDRVLATGCPPVTSFTARMGPVTLEGFGPAVDGIAAAYCPRRLVLDKILVDAAAKAGVEVREGFSVQEITMDSERVTGIRGRDAQGNAITETARIVVGADGLHSLVARAVSAPTYNEKPALACYYYTYWEGLPYTQGQFGQGDAGVFVGFPTNDGLYCLIVGRKHADFQAYRADIEGTYFRTIEELDPEVAATVRAGRRAERWMGTADLPNVFHKPYGSGWALVGDAGYHRDPITGYGITDAFRDAEWLSEALIAGLGGQQPVEEALAEYEQRRNEFTFPLYELICQMASMEVPPPEMQALQAALVGNQEAITRFFGVLDGSVSVPEFFAQEHIGAIMAAAQQRDAAA